MASASVHSSGAWLTPPASLRTNSIALGTPAMAMIVASWPAPEGSSTGSRPSAAIACRTAARGTVLIGTGA